MGRRHIRKLSTKGRRCSLTVVRVSVRIPFALNTHHKHSLKSMTMNMVGMVSARQSYTSLLWEDRGALTYRANCLETLLQQNAHCVRKYALFPLTTATRNGILPLYVLTGWLFPLLGWRVQARMLTFSLCSSHGLSLEQADKHPGFLLKSTEEHEDVPACVCRGADRPQCGWT